MKKNLSGYLRLFWEMFILSAFTFGGGYVIVTLMQRKFVMELHWIEREEMMDLAAIAQSAPGAVAVNASIIVGYKLGGVFGAVIACIGTVLPPLIVITAIAFVYDWFKQNAIVAALLRGMQAGVAAVIFDVVIDMALQIIKDKKPLYIILMAAAFITSYFFGLNVIIIILCCGAAGIIATWYRLKKGGMDK